MNAFLLRMRNDELNDSMHEFFFLHFYLLVHTKKKIGQGFAVDEDVILQTENDTNITQILWQAVEHNFNLFL